MAKQRLVYGLDRPIDIVPPHPVIASRAPTTGDLSYELGQMWVHAGAAGVYVLTNVAAGSATWTTVS